MAGMAGPGMAGPGLARQDMAGVAGPGMAGPGAARHGTSNMLAWNLTLDDVREAICQCIRNEDRVKVTTVKTHPKALVGQPAYEVTQAVGGRRFYIRMAIFQPDPNKEALLVVSVHPDV